MAEWILDVNKCDLCVGRNPVPCIKVCTMKVLKIEDNQLKNMDKKQCMSCRYCRSECPQGAIKFR